MSDLGATQEFYTRWARLYDVLATAPGIDSWRATTADALDLAPGDTVVEMGCGTGANFPHLRERVGPEGTVLGIDLTTGMLAEAQRRIDREGWANVHLVRGDAREPPIDGPVDAILGTFVVGMFQDPDAVVTDWLDLLEPDRGTIALLNATRSPHPLAAPLNLAFRGFVRLSTPRGGKGTGTLDRSPTNVLEDRIDAAASALERGTAESERQLLAGGFVRLHRGQV
jgi:ubiquinone/menaquinone biosynthesis C-methylase UbiE